MTDAPAVAPDPRRKRRRLALALAALGAVALVALFLARRGPSYAGPSIREDPAFQDPARLGRAWALPVARTYERRLDWQSNGSTCGAASLANLTRSLGVTVAEGEVLSRNGICRTGICFGGVTLDELAEMARTVTGRRVTVVRDLTWDAFRAMLPELNDPSRRFVANFHRGPLFGRGGGHHSPLGGWLEADDRVLVLDVNQEYQPWLVEPRRLFEAMDTVDGSTDEKRGLLVVE